MTLSVGWREWVALPELGIHHIKAKVDTGARTSALHAFEVEPVVKDGKPFVKFSIHPLQGNTEYSVTCEAPVSDYRQVTDSGGHREMRYVITTPIQLGDQVWNVEITLTNRENMKFRMLLGRTALKGRFLVDSSKSYLVGAQPPDL